jgi:predicted dithiol-disulfide oxidoreductase (DUF899 family)
MGVTFPNESAEHRAARNQLLDQEIALRRQVEAVAAARRALPPGGLVPTDYVFQGLGQDQTPTAIRLSELFAPGRDTLITYNYMFPRAAQDPRPLPGDGAIAEMAKAESPCPSCTAFLDGLDGAAQHIEGLGFNLVVIAKAPLERLVAVARDREWRNLRLLSTAGTTFKRDYHSELPDGTPAPMLTVFQRRDDGIRHFWSAEMNYTQPDAGQDPRGNDMLSTLWNAIDLTPEGRPEGYMERFEYLPAVGAKPSKTQILPVTRTTRATASR